MNASTRVVGLLLLLTGIVAAGCNPAALGGTIALLSGGDSGGGPGTPPPANLGHVELVNETVAPGGLFQVVLRQDQAKQITFRFEADVNDANLDPAPIQLTAVPSGIDGTDPVTVTLSAQPGLPQEHYHIRCTFSDSRPTVEAPQRVLVTELAAPRAITWATDGSSSGTLQMAATCVTPTRDLAVAGNWTGEISLPGINAPSTAGGRQAGFVGILQHDGDQAGKVVSFVLLDRHDLTPQAPNPDARVEISGITPSRSAVANELFVCGSFKGTCSFGKQPGQNTVTTLTSQNPGRMDGFVAKYRPSTDSQELRLIWIKHFKANDECRLTCIDLLEHPVNDLLAVGGSIVNTGGNTAALLEPIAVTGQGPSDGIVVVLEADSDFVQATLVGGNEPDVALVESVTSVSADLVENVPSIAIAASAFDRNSSGLSIRHTDIPTPNPGSIGEVPATRGGLDIVLAMIQLSPTPLRFAVTAGSERDDRAARIVMTRVSGSIHMVGTMPANMTFQSRLAADVPLPGIDEGFVVKYDRGGQIRWARVLADEGQVSATDITLFPSADPEIGVVGTFDEPITLPPTAATAPATRLRGGSGKNMFVARLSSDFGNLQSVRTLTSTGDSPDVKIQGVDFTDYFLAGTFQGGLLLPPNRTFFRTPQGLFFTSTQTASSLR